MYIIERMVINIGVELNKYTDLPLTSFPTSVDFQRIYEDVGADTISDVKKFNNYISNEDFESARQLLIDKPEIRKCIALAEDMNRHEHQIIAIQRFYSEDFQKYIINAIKNKGNWDENVAYSKFDVVFYNGLAYMGIKENIPIGVVPTNINYFFPQTLKGDKGDKGENGTGLLPKGIWYSETDYYINDFVSHNSLLYYAKQDSKGKPPDTSPNYWEYIHIVFNDVIDGGGFE